MVSRITDTAHDPSVRGQVRTYNAGVVDNAGAVRYVGGRMNLYMGGVPLPAPVPFVYVYRSQNIKTHPP